MARAAQHPILRFDAETAHCYNPLTDRRHGASACLTQAHVPDTAAEALASDEGVDLSETAFESIHVFAPVRCG